ncbi:hypothetical protein PC116_g25746 [Phytophthora cactorum]|nr:hypothetical protein PC116_g25746 [Phytophthora cactorum]
MVKNLTQYASKKNIEWVRMRGVQDITNASVAPVNWRAKDSPYLPEVVNG